MGCTERVGAYQGLRLSQSCRAMRNGRSGVRGHSDQPFWDGGAGSESLVAIGHLSLESPF